MSPGALIDGIEALAALERTGTVSEAAARLRLTQSATSKRLAALGRAVGYPVVRPAGRRLQLTAEGLDLLERARPLLASLQELALPVHGGPATFSLALSESIAASWGPYAVAAALRSLPDVRVELHAHRTVLLVESVRLGRYHAGLSTDLPSPPDLLREPLSEEPLVLARSGLGPEPRFERPLIAIEPSSATWRATEPLLRRHRPDLLERPRIPVESFSAALQMVRAGFGDGLLPLGLVREVDPTGAGYEILPGIQRQITLVARKTVHHLPRFAALRDALRTEIARLERSRPPPPDGTTPGREDPCAGA